MNFAERLYELRKASGMTQSDLAEKLDVSRQAVSRWEMGTAMPDTDNLIALSGLFGVTVDYLLKGDAVPAIAVPMAEEPEPAPEKKRNWFRLWLILTAAATAVVALIVLIAVLADSPNDASVVAIHPRTVIVQLINIAALLGIVLFIIWFVKEKLNKK